MTSLPFSVTMRMPAPPGDVFAPDAFASNIGKTMQVVGPDREHTGVITAAEVADDGLAVTYTVTVVEITIKE